MPKNKNIKNNKLLEAIIYFSILIIIVLTTININSFLKPTQTKVLGISIDNSEGVFWYQLLQKHPNYIPGWIESGRTDKVSAIDPNYNIR